MAVLQPADEFDDDYAAEEVLAQLLPDADPGADRSGIADRTRSPVRRMRRLEETADEPGVLRSSAGGRAYCTATVDSGSDSSRKQFD